jgi:hypothetical protein
VRCAHLKTVFVNLSDYPTQSAVSAVLLAQKRGWGKRKEDNVESAGVTSLQGPVLFGAKETVFGD